jgi:hypothetical protein
MMGTELRTQVVAATLGLAAALALPAAWLGGATAGLGLAAGALLAAANFWSLSGRAAALAAGSPGRGWLAAAGARLALVAAAAAALFAYGAAHPVAVVAGLTLLPCTLIVRALRAGGEVA